MHLNLLFVCVALVAANVALASANFVVVPVLAYLNNDKAVNSISVGQVINFDSLFGDLSKLNGNLEVIMLNQLSDQDLTPFLRKSTFNNVNYFPLVNNPEQGLNDYMKNNKAQKISVSNVNNLNEALAKFSQNVANKQFTILTGQQPDGVSVSRMRRAVKDADTNQSNLFYGDNCAASFQEVYYTDSTKSSSSTPISLKVLDSSSFVCKTNTDPSTLTLNFDPTNAGIAGDVIKSVSFVFNGDSRYWTYTNGTLTTAKNTYAILYMEAPYGMETPQSFCFVCTRTHFRLVNTQTNRFEKVDFYINYLQFQPYYASPNGTTYSFGKVNYCQGFFSSGIWMAITSSLLLIAILAFGVMMLFNIKTMDRFDDPKGKPLTIAQEK